MSLRAVDVFTPSSYPVHTFVNRTDHNAAKQLLGSLDMKGQIVSISGPSKCGKTVLVESVVGQETLIPVTGAGIRSAADVWERIFDWIGEPTARTAADTKTSVLGGQLSLQTTAKLPLIAETSVTAQGKYDNSKAQQTSITVARRGIAQIIQDVAASGYVVHLDNFHYIERSIQTDIVEQIKEASRQGLKVIISTVPHRSDDVVRSLPDIRGRVTSIDIGYWRTNDLEQIARMGLSKLKVEIDDESIRAFAREAAGSPQLMQAICMYACKHVGADEGGESHIAKLTESDREQILEWTSTMTSHKTVVDLMAQGPKTRGSERIIYLLHSGDSGDVYECLVRALAADPPQLSFNYVQLTKRINAIAAGGQVPGSSISSACQQVYKVVLNTSPESRILDWDAQKQVLDIADPYLLFYLRWCGKYRQRLG